MRGRIPSPPRMFWYYSLLILISIAVFFFRINKFGDMEPRGDQAFFSWWVQGLYQADHFLPVVEAGESWFNALQRDDSGFLHRLLRVVYSRAISVFTFVTLTLRYAMTWVLGPTNGAQVAMSLFASAGIVFSLGLFPVLARGRRSEQVTWSHTKIKIVGIAALFLGATTAYLHIYSPLSVHNFSVFFLLIAAAFGTRVLKASAYQNSLTPIRREYLLAAIAYGLAFFSHWTNLFLLPAATFLSILAMPDLSVRKRVSLLVGFVVFSAVLALPFLIAAGLEGSRNLVSNSISISSFIESNLSLGDGELWQNVARRSGGWLEKGSQLFSMPGMVLGFLGVLALAKWERIILPFFIVVCHFLVWCALKDFETAYLRTFLYAIAFLVLGAAYLAVVAAEAFWSGLKQGAFEYKALAGLAILGLLATHIYIQLPPLLSSQQIRNRVPEAWEEYYSGQGSLAPVMAEIDSILPNDAVVVTWGYGIQFLLRNYEIEGAGRTVAPTLLTMIPRFEDGTLPDYIKRHHLSVPADVPMFTIIDHDLDQVDRETVRRGIEKVFGPKGFGTIKKAALEPIGRWRLDSSWPRDVALYRVLND